MLILWLVLGLVFLVVESRHFAFYAFFAAIGSFAAAVVAAVAPGLIAAQVGAAVVVAALGVWLIRPFMSRAFHRNGSGHPGAGVHGAIVGQEVITLDEVGDAHHVGHVRLTGERWLAVTESGRRLPAGTRAIVTAVRGTTLVVWPVDGDLELPIDVPPGLQPGPPTSPADPAGEES